MGKKKSTDSSNSSKGGLGNTKTKPQDAAKKRWCFTLHNYTSNSISILKSFFSSNKSKFIFSEEKGKSGETPHLQGYFELPVKKRFTALLKSFKCLDVSGIHLQGAGGDREDNIIYISKEGGKMYGNLVPEDIYCEEPSEKLKFLVDEMEMYNHGKGDRLIHCVVDEIGGLGKTEFARWCCIHMEGCIVSGGKAADMKNQIVEYMKVNVRTPRYIIMDIPRSNLDYLSYQGIEDVKNMLFYSGKYEGSMVNGNKPFVLMLMNEYPKIENLSSDRWRVYKINNEDDE